MHPVARRASLRTLMATVATYLCPVDRRVILSALFEATDAGIKRRVVAQVPWPAEQGLTQEGGRTAAESRVLLLTTGDSHVLCCSAIEPSRSNPIPGTSASGRGTVSPPNPAPTPPSVSMASSASTPLGRATSCAGSGARPFMPRSNGIGSLVSRAKWPLPSGVATP